MLAKALFLAGEHDAVAEAEAARTSRASSSREDERTVVAGGLA